MKKSLQIYEKGTIKIVWIEKDPGKIYSKMFNSIPEALIYSKKLEDYLIFKLISHKEMRDFSWEILPYGNSKLYGSLMRFYQKNKAKLKKFNQTSLSKLLKMLTNLS